MPRTGPTAIYAVPGLRARRLAQHLTQRDIAGRASISVYSVTKLEAGKKARPATLDKLAVALGCTVEALLTVPD